MGGDGLPPQLLSQCHKGGDKVTKREAERIKEAINIILKTQYDYPIILPGEIFDAIEILEYLAETGQLSDHDDQKDC